MKSGPLDDLITIERDTGTGENAFGEITEGWTTHTSAWAEVIYGKGSERRTSATEGADQPAIFRVRAEPETRNVTVKDRINFNGIWDITDVIPRDRDGIEYTAIRRASA